MKLSSLRNLYKGATCFLIGGGRSIDESIASKLMNAGVLTMAMNNAAKTVRPDLWCCVDNPSVFIPSIFLDPKIIKFVPQVYRNACVGATDQKALDLPGVVTFRANTKMEISQFFESETVCFGTRGEESVRSILLAALKIAYVIGIRRIYLVGVDFNMTPGEKNYSFDQETSEHAVKSNNTSYARLNVVLNGLTQLCVDSGIEVYNTNHASSLTAFDFVPLDTALNNALTDLPDIHAESTKGRYEKSYELADKFHENRTQRQTKRQQREQLSAKKQIVLSGISRSGTHALCNWIGAQHNGNVQYRNDLMRHGNYRYIHQPHKKAIPANWYNLPDVAYEATDKVDLFLYSYENQQNKLELYPSIQSETSYRVQLLRDPFNLLASSVMHTEKGNRFWFYKTCMLDGKITHETLTPFYDLWMQHAALVREEGIVPVLYNRWFDSSEYRDSIADTLGFDFRSDEAMEKVSSNGRGSSFDRMAKDGAATEMNVNQRFLHYMDQTWFKEFFNSHPDMVSVSNELFGELKGLEL